jgi:enoyl-[acyl-carrier protein] reductase II
MEKSGASIAELEKAGEGTLRMAAIDGDIKFGSVMSGQIAGLVNKEESCEEIITDLMKSAFDTINSFKTEASS